MRERNKALFITLPVIIGAIIIASACAPQRQSTPSSPIEGAPTPKALATNIAQEDQPNIKKAKASLPDVYFQSHIELHTQNCAFFALSNNQNQEIFSFGDVNLLLNQENKYQTAIISPTSPLKNESVAFQAKGINHYKTNVGEAWGEQHFTFSIPKNHGETTFVTMDCLSGQVTTDKNKPKDPIQMPMDIDIQNCAALTVTDEEYVPVLSFASPTGLNDQHREIVIPQTRTEGQTVEFTVKGTDHRKDSAGYMMTKLDFNFEYQITNPPQVKHIAINCQERTITP